MNIELHTFLKTQVQRCYPQVLNCQKVDKAINTKGKNFCQQWNSKDRGAFNITELLSTHFWQRNAFKLDSLYIILAYNLILDLCTATYRCASKTQPRIRCTFKICRCSWSNTATCAPAAQVLMKKKSTTNKHPSSPFPDQQFAAWIGHVLTLQLMLAQSELSFT